MRSTFGTISKRGHNAYRIQWYDRNHVRHSKEIKGTRATAAKELSRIELQVTHAGGEVTYEEYWQEYVLPTFGALKPKTVSEYNRLWNVELAPRIAKWKVGETSWRDVQNVIDCIDASSVQRKVCTLWKKIINMAIRDEYATKNPCTGIKFKAHTKRAKRLLDVDGVYQLLGAIQGIKYEPVLLVLLGGGLSVCEACALTWDDVEEWEGFAVVTINKDVVTCDGRALHQESTKNEHRTREVVIGAPFAARLLFLKGKDKETPNERRLCQCAPTTTSHNYKAWCERHNIAYIRLGDFRSV